MASAMRQIRAKDRQGGFTLVEMLVAMGILVLGFTTLIGLLSIGVSTRRTAERRNQAVQAVDGVLLAVREKITTAAPPPEGAEGEPELIVLDRVPGHERLRAVATITSDEADPTLLLLEIRISWVEEGTVVGEEFHRVITMNEPFSVRAARARSKS